METNKTKIHSFTDLFAWREAHKLVLKVYENSKNWPKEEIYGLTSQIRRCVVSITSNIAEGFSRQTWKEKLQFYSIALGSLTEFQNQILIAKDLGYIQKSIFDLIANQTVTISKLIHGLMKSLKISPHNT